MLIHRLLFDSNPLNIAWVDEDKKYRAININYSEFFGIDIDSAIGKPIMEILGEELYEKINGHVESALQGNTIEYEAVTYNYKGEKCHIHTKIVPFIDSNNIRDGFVVFMDDITKRKSIEENQQQLQHQLTQAQKIESIGMLAGGVAHDI